MSGLNIPLVTFLGALVIIGTLSSFHNSGSFFAFKRISASEAEVFSLWQKWKIVHQKSYSSDEEEIARFAIFQTNNDFIDSWNNNPNNTVLLGLNQFADMTQEEYAAYSSDTVVPSQPSQPATYLNASSLPTSVNWTAQGAVSPVQNQGMCSSCWAFSVVGSVESLYFIENEVLYNFSAQQLVDCSFSFGNNGCKSGQLGNAFQYLTQNGIETNRVYPYTGKQGVCEFDESEVIYTPDGYHNVPPYDSVQLMTASAAQPVAIVVEADQAVFQFYRAGVITSGCGQAVNHGLLLVGYGTDPSSKMDFWYAKNFYGTTWGEQGYVRMQRSNTTNVCGVLTAPSYPYSN